MFEELNKYGKSESLHICDNLDDHMVGNVYVQIGEKEQDVIVVDIVTLCTLKRSAGNCDISCLEDLVCLIWKTQLSTMFNDDEKCPSIRLA
ncbi:hypothetical protein H5410_006591 [Solanum commersonii]|uniref:Uncharacterized protein n=1 Tax=Solanum commersonii TaxID=4109 RepID=A0A9J6A9S3_SOLCO|nr:hypothetical protein H5410_006591 [Solanum commersonii]